jgi:chromosome segregation ATPase
MANPIWVEGRREELSMEDVEQVGEVLAAALAPLSSLQLRWLLVDHLRRVRVLVEDALRVRNESDALVEELAGAEQEAAAAAERLAKAQRDLKDAEKDKARRLMPVAEAQERLHVAESNAKAAADAVEGVRAALERRRELVRA